MLLQRYVPLLIGLVRNIVALPTSTSTTSSGVVCSATFSPISASAWVEGVSPGWNIGNTLDATPDETSWGMPKASTETFQTVKDAGFTGIRLPVTYTYHFTTGSPTWTVDPTWLARVAEVVDEIIALDLYVITNVHHDSSAWADLTATDANYTAIEEQFYRLWYQIGETLACKSSLLAFEPINEPGANTAAQRAELFKLEGIFLQALADSGGYNSKRVVTLVGPGEGADATSEYFNRSMSITNPWAIQYHYYSPYSFIFGAWGTTIWGSDSDKTSLSTDLAAIRGNFTDVPLLIGEWDASTLNTEMAARWKYNDYFARTAKEYNTGIILWDNGFDQLDRYLNKWRDPTAISIIINAANGTTNSLADSTESTTVTTQESSAYIYHRYGTNVTDQTLPYLFNGNTLVSISAGETDLVEGTDYTVSGEDITYKASFLSTYISETTTPGSIVNLTLSFSEGSTLIANILQWDVPTICETSGSVDEVDDGDAYYIPVEWAGLPKVATVKALTTNGTYLVASWTKWLGPLQRARLTYSGQWSYDSGTGEVILESEIVQDVIAAGEDVVFTIEFYPRTPDNSVNFTLTV